MQKQTTTHLATTSPVTKYHFTCYTLENLYSEHVRDLHLSHF